MSSSTRPLVRLVPSLLALSLVVAACAPGDEQPPARGSAGPLPEGATLPTDHPPLGPVPGTPGAESVPGGHPPIGTAPGAATAPADAPVALVKETMDSGGYTYALLEIDGDEIWAAGPPSELAEGDRVALAGAMGMENFTAASLDRTFERILFVSGFVPR